MQGYEGKNNLGILDHNCDYISGSGKTVRLISVINH